MVFRLPPVTRRQFVIGSSVAASAYWLPQAGFAAGTDSRRRLIVFTLRGGLDGLHAVPPYGDPSYAPARGAIAIPSPNVSGGAFKLDGLFGLHPAMPNFYSMYKGGQALVVHAAAPPYQDHSHFTAQDILENGTTVRSTPDGWMGRALKLRDQDRTPSTIEALAIGTYMTPLMLEGAPSSAGWTAKIVNVSSTFSSYLKAAYKNDARFSKSFAYMPQFDQLSALAPEQLTTWADCAAAGAALLASPLGPDVIVFDLNGWDSHAYQGGVTGMIAGSLSDLDGMFGALKSGLGNAWNNTVGVALTEFGRTVEVNGTGGTDHGVGTAAYMFGGAVKGGRVIADWPGLDMAHRLNQRDLMPTTDYRSILKGVLQDHWGFSEDMLGRVFPDSADAPALEGLLRSSTTATQPATPSVTAPSSGTSSGFTPSVTQSTPVPPPVSKKPAPKVGAVSMPKQAPKKASVKGRGLKG